jgi:RecB family endonuclease NucS
MIHESKIRDSLATKLHLIEHGLSLEGIESPVKNSQGTTGRLDIYARDQFQYRVIIEIKRSTKASREAIHELYK